jgi:maltose O-acetyltransferase
VTEGRTQRERMLAGQPYLADDPELVAARARARALMDAFNRDGQPVLAELLGAAGDGCEIRPPLYVDYGFNLFVGARTFANYGLVALDVVCITIGDDVQIGPNVQLLTPKHPLDAAERRAKWESGAPITIGDNVWLGGGAIVLPGVTIGDHTVVGAGAVVTHDLPANVVVAGNPARVIRGL